MTSEKEKTALPAQTDSENQGQEKDAHEVKLGRLERVQRALDREPKRYTYLVLNTIITLVVLGWSATSLKLQSGHTDSMKIAKSILGGIVSPDLGFLFSIKADGVPYLLFETICIAFLGTVIGAIISMPFALISTSRLMPRPIAWLGRFLVMCIRTIPSLVYGLMFIRVTGPGPFAGALTMSVVSIGMVTKLYIDTLEELDMSIVEALSAMGCNKFEQVRYGILPQLYSNLASIVIYRFDMNLRDAAVLGLVGAGGIGAPLLFAMQGYKWNQAGSILWGLVILILMIEVFSTYLRRRLARG